MKYKIGDVFITTGRWAERFPDEKIKVIDLDDTTYICQWIHYNGKLVNDSAYQYTEFELDNHILDEVTQVKRLLDKYAD